MDKEARIIALGRNSEIADQAKNAIEDYTGLRPQRVILDAISVISEPYLAALSEMSPDIVILCLDRHSEDDLNVLSLIPEDKRPSHLLIAFRSIDAESINLRLAMKAGASDAFPLPDEAQELAETVDRLQKSLRITDGKKARITIVMSVTGGGGASTVAAGLAVVFAQDLHRKTLLLDLDVQFGTQYLTHDITPEKGLREAIQQAASLDHTALQGYVTQHPMGFDLVGILPEQLCIEGDLPVEDVQSFVDLLAENYEEIIIDQPCQVGGILGQLLPESTRIVLIVHQDLASIKNTIKLIQILTTDLEQPVEHIGYIINKHDTKHAIQSSDIEKALGIQCFGKIPLDPEFIDGAVAHGVPLRKHAPKAKSTLALSDAGRRLAGFGSSPHHAESLLSRFAHFWRGK